MSWRLTTEAFKCWRRIVVVRRVAERAGDEARLERLNALGTIAWQRYVRRWRRAEEGMKAKENPQSDGTRV